MYSHISCRDSGGILWFLVLSWAACFLEMLQAASWGFFFLPPFPSFCTSWDAKFLFHIHFSLPTPSSGKDFHNGLVVKNLPASRRCGFDPWVRKFPWERKWQPPPAFLPGKFHGQRLEGYSPWGHKESDMTKLLSISSGNVHERSKKNIILSLCLIVPKSI